MKIRFIVVLLMGLFISLASQAAVDWSAQWIWQAEDGPANTWVAFRKEFDLKTVPETALANIATDTKYWLWINGELVVFEGGLARGPSPGNTYCDEVDIQKHLKSGENTAAILVWYWGKTAKTHDDSGNGGLFFSADLGENFLKSDATWKLKVHPAYDPESKGLQRSANRANAMDIKFDARKALGDWSDDAWYSKNYLTDESWNPATEKGVPPTEPWGKLIKRAIPLWNDRGLTDYESLEVGKTQITLPYKNESDEKVVINAKLPFNKQVTPYLKIKSGGGKTIAIGMDNRFNLINAQYSSNNGEQAFETYSWMNGHIVYYTIPPGVEVLELKHRWTGLGSVAGSFECSDPFFERIWWMAGNTLYVCARDSYMDCPDRERGFWIGDVADQTGAVFYTLDEPGRQLLKKGIDNTFAYQTGDIIQGLAPGFGEYRGKSSELCAQSLQYIEQGIWAYYFNTGDRETLALAYPFIQRYLKLWNMLENGLPEERKGYASWVDWGLNPDEKPVQVCWYHMALKSAKRMAHELGKTEEVAWYDSRIKSIEESFDTVYWRDGYYGSVGQPKDERVSALAILTGLADERAYSSMLETVLIPEHNASPHMEWMVEEAIMLTGHYAAGLERMKQRHASQVNNVNMTTLSERYDNDRPGTYNHAWNAPNYVLSRYIAGIAADEVAWKSYHVLPNLAHMTAVKQVVPSVKGDISVDIKHTNSTYTMELISPAETTALVGIPMDIIKVQTIQINGTVVFKDGKPASKLSGISFSGRDDQYIKFKVSPGTWTFIASNNE